MMTNRTKQSEGKFYAWDDEWGESRLVGHTPEGIEIWEIDGGWREIEPTGLQRLMAKVSTWLFGCNQ